MYAMLFSIGKSTGYPLFGPLWGVIFADEQRCTFDLSRIFIILFFFKKK